MKKLFFNFMVFVTVSYGAVAYEQTFEEQIQKDLTRFDRKKRGKKKDLLRERRLGEKGYKKFNFREDLIDDISEGDEYALAVGGVELYRRDELIEKLIFSDHAKSRMKKRGITEEQIKEVIKKGQKRNLTPEEIEKHIQKRDLGDEDSKRFFYEENNKFKKSINVLLAESVLFCTVITAY
ncbi:MAG: hypothetical protein UR26_C0010G0010 [candidate division TM6 bacterium GW2011_GWF2_32_72]|nr:MAG: hypothetical protein UR26_C0010G0010 [candidate division TM6 bacterium GW2011_GWF2_32_72]